MIGGKHSAAKPTALGAMVNASTYGMTIPNIYGMTKSNLLIIWLANLRQHGSSKKAKKKGPPTFAANADLMIGSNPIRQVLQMWGDNNKRYALGFDEYTLPSISNGPSHLWNIPDPDFYAVVAVTADQVLTANFNDYGAQGPVAYSGTTEIPLWNGADHGPDLVDAAIARWWPYVYYWTAAMGANIQLPWLQSFQAPAEGLPNGNGNVHIYYAKLIAESGGKGKSSSTSPLAQLRLSFESQLGSGNEYADAGLGSQQIIYPYYAGLESSELDLGSSGLVPALRAEVQGSYSLYSRGDADFMDMAEDIIKSGQLQTGEALGEIHRGVNLNELPGAVQKNLYQNLEPTTNPSLPFQQPVQANSLIFGFVKWRPTAGGTPPDIDSTGAESWIPIGTGTGGFGWGFWYAIATGGVETVNFHSNNTAGFDFDTRPFILEMDPATTQVLGTVSHEGNSPGTNQKISASITINSSDVAPGQPVYLLVALAAISIQQNVYNTMPYHWNNLFSASVTDTSGSIMAYRIVYGPGTYTIDWVLPFGGEWAINLVALTQPNPPSYAKALGAILEPTTLQATRNQCRANGLIGSLTMNSQKKAADWLVDIFKCANCAPVWSGFRLKLIPWSEVSAVGNGTIYTAYTAAGPIANLTQNDFIGDAGQPILSIERKAQVDAPNIKQIQHIDRDNDYNPIVTSQVEQSSSALYAPRKDQPQLLEEIQAPAVARMILGIQTRREVYIRRVYKGKLQARFYQLEPMDLVTIDEPLLGISQRPVRVVSVEEDKDYNLDVEFEDFFYGVHSPTPVPVTTTAPFSPPSADTAGDVNAPIIFEPVPRLTENQKQQLWLVISSPSANYGGAIVNISIDGGTSYNALSPLVIGNAATGVTTSDWPAGSDPDTTNDLPLDLTESLGTLDSFQIGAEDSFTFPCYVEHGLSCITYALMTYAVAQLTGANLYTLKATGGNKLRRCVFSAPQPLNDVDHPSGSRFALLNPNGNGILKLDMDPRWIGTALKFKIQSFNTLGGGIQPLAGLTVYTYTPTGCPAGAQNPNVNNYRVIGGALTQPCGTPTQIKMAQATVVFPSNSANYNARTFTIPTPTAPTTYYITILDPQYLGDTGALTNLLSFADTSTGKIGQPGYVYMGAILALPAGCGVQSAPGGMPATLPAVFTSKPAKVIALAPGTDGNFTVAHGLGVTPAFVMIQMNSPSAIWLQNPTSFDATNLYLTSADASATGFAVIWTVPADQEVALAPGAAGNFTVAHGLGAVPQLALIEMNSGGAIWFQSTPWDSTNLYLVASDDVVTGKAQVLGAHTTSVAPTFARVPLAPSGSGNFTIAHGLGVTPTAVVIRMSSGGAIWLQSPTGFDGTNLFLAASDAGITGEADVWG